MLAACSHAAQAQGDDEPVDVAPEGREHHLLPADVGRMASAAGVGAVVVTHFVGREPDDPAHLEYLREIAAFYDGPVVIANDMDAF